MTAEHKQALRANRDVLVENMTPDDIFNDLISKHIVTSADISRIKEKNTVEAINEVSCLFSLLDNFFFIKSSEFVWSLFSTILL